MRTWIALGQKQIFFTQVMPFNEKLARLFIYASLFALPYSHFLVNQFIVAAAIFSLLSGNWAAKRQWLKVNYFLWLALTLFIWLFISCFYAAIPFHISIAALGKYSKLLYLPLFMPLFINPESRTKAINYFIASLFIAVVISLLIYLSHFNYILIPLNHQTLLSPDGTNGMFINVLPFSLLSSIGVYITVYRVLEKEKPLLNLALAILFFLHLFMINGERTGCFSVLLFIPLFLWQRQGWKGLGLALILLPIISGTLYITSPSFHNKVYEFGASMHKFHNHQINYSNTGYRLMYLQYSWHIFKEKPILGTGVGGFTSAYAKAGGEVEGAATLGEPHNEYAFIAVEGGAIGLILYLSWLLSVWFGTFSLDKMEKSLAQALCIAITFSGMTTPILTRNTLGWIFIILLSVLCASQLKKNFKSSVG